MSWITYNQPNGVYLKDNFSQGLPQGMARGSIAKNNKVLSERSELDSFDETIFFLVDLDVLIIFFPSSQKNNKKNLAPNPPTL